MSTVSDISEEDTRVPDAVVQGDAELNALLTEENQYEAHHVDLYCPANALIVALRLMVLQRQ